SPAAQAPLASGRRAGEAAGAGATSSVPAQGSAWYHPASRFLLYRAAPAPRGPRKTKPHAGRAGRFMRPPVPMASVWQLWLRIASPGRCENALRASPRGKLGRGAARRPDLLAGGLELRRAGEAGQPHELRHTAINEPRYWGADGWACSGLP